MVKLVTKAESDKDVLSVKAGESVYRAGDAATEMFLVKEGCVELTRSIGSDEARLALVEAGGFFGEVALLEDSPCDFSARAVTACKLLRLDGPTLREVLKHDPEIALRMIRRLSRRLHTALAAQLEAESAMHLETGRPQAPKAKTLPPKPKPAEAPAAAKRPLRPRLVHSGGDEFPLPIEGEAVVGRADPVKGYQPDVVLSSLDAKRSLSRRHAKLFRAGGDFWVVEEPGVRNGTFLNGKALKPGQPKKVHDGDEISFGLIKTVFRLE